MAAVALVIVCSGCGGPVLGARASAPPSRGPTGPLVLPALDAPPGWTTVGSPWLGYSLALPDAWAFTGHVPPEGSRSPHDVYAGPVPGSERDATLVVGRCATSDPTAAGDGAEELVVDGSAFRVAQVPGDEPGRTIYRATATRDGSTWYLMACAGDDAASEELFRAVLATFRFPDASPSAPGAMRTDES
jgi:hypothetical protein